MYKATEPLLNNLSINMGKTITNVFELEGVTKIYGEQ